MSGTYVRDRSKIFDGLPVYKKVLRITVETKTILYRSDGGVCKDTEGCWVIATSEEQVVKDEGVVRSSDPSPWPTDSELCWTKTGAASERVVDMSFSMVIIILAFPLILALIFALVLAFTLAISLASPSPSPYLRYAGELGTTTLQGHMIDDSAPPSSGISKRPATETGDAPYPVAAMGSRPACARRIGDAVPRTFLLSLPSL